MKRKVVQHGPSTLIVSLPSTWAKKHNIKKGDELELDEKGKTLFITTHAVAKKLSISADVSRLNSFLVSKFLERSYQKGYDKLVLKHNDVNLLGALKNQVHSLMGFEVLEENEKMCMIESISPRINLNFENSLRRSFIIVKEMIETCHEAYKSGDKKSLTNLYLRDSEVNKLTYFCLRHINKEHYADPEQKHTKHVMYFLVEMLEDLGDSCKRMAYQLASTKRKNKAITKVLNLLRKQYETTYTYFYKPTEDKAIEGNDFHGKVGEAIEEAASQSLQKEEIMVLTCAEEARNVINHYITMKMDFIPKYEVDKDANYIS